MTTAPLTDRRFLRRSAPPAPERVASGQFRPSASHPIPPLRSVADFVALPSTRRYVTVKGKFLIALGGAALWLLLAVIVSLAFLGSLAEVVSWPAAVLMAIFVVYVPAYLTAFSCIGIVLDDPPALEIVHPTTPVTVVVRSDRQPKDVVVCLAYLAAQDYDGPLSVLLVDHASTDDTVAEACRAARQLELDLKVVVERRDGRAHAYNTGLACVDTPVFVTLDAGTFLHPSAVRLLVARLMSSPSDTAAVAGHAFVRNARQGTFAEYEATDYALAVNAAQRLHGLFQGALVAEGACGVFRTDAVRAVNGWPPVVGEDVVLTWRFLERGWRVFHEPLAVAFSTEPISTRSLGRRRARAAVGLVDAIREAGVRSLRFPFSRFLTVVDVAAPLLDLCFAVCWLPAVVLAALGHAGLVGWYLLFVLPLSLATSAIVRRNHNEVMDEIGLKPHRSPAALLASLLTFHAVQAPLSIWSYALELADASNSTR
ncbi:MAG TPA: glycosyltransferase [Acidimicrobiia bacterium]|nr:glycosyltransferase [Acidimicrobiia bacterium]